MTDAYTLILERVPVPKGQLMTVHESLQWKPQNIN